MRLGGKFIKKFGEIKLLLWSDIPGFIANIIVIVFPTVITPIVNAANSFPYGLGNVAQNSLLQKEFTDKQRATIASFNSLVGNLVFAIIAFLFGLFADRVGPRIVLLVGQILSVGVLALYFKLFKLSKLEQRPV